METLSPMLASRGLDPRLETVSPSHQLSGVGIAWRHCLQCSQPRDESIAWRQCLHAISSEVGASRGDTVSNALVHETRASRERDARYAKILLTLPEVKICNAPSTKLEHVRYGESTMTTPQMR